MSDYSLQIVALFNGQTGTVTIVNITTGRIYKITYSSQTANYLWLSSKTSFSAYFRTLSSLQELYNIGERQGQRVSIDSQEISYIFTQFGTHLTTQETFDLFVSFVSHLQRNLKLVYERNSSFTTHQNIQWFLSVNLALGDLLDNANGNLSNSDVWRHLNLTAIFNASSGVEALLSFLSQIGNNVDLAKQFSSYLSSPPRMEKLLEKLGGGSNNGLDGIITIVVNIIQTMEGHGSINKVISSIINYNASADGNNDNLTTIINEFLELAASQGRRYDSSARWAEFVKVLQSLNNQNFIFNNVNISDIIKLLRWYHPNEAIPTIIKILSKFLPSRGIPQFFGFIINLLNNTNGSEVISRLLPGTDWRNLTGYGNLLQGIFRGHNLTDLFSHPCKFTSLFQNIPVFGEIIHRISGALGNGVDINQFMNVSTLNRQLENISGGGAGGLGNFFNISRIPLVIQHGIGNVAHGFEDIVHAFSGKC